MTHLDPAINNQIRHFMLANLMYTALPFIRCGNVSYVRIFTKVVDYKISTKFINIFKIQSLKWQFIKELYI